jgi:hypothetical protein
MLFGFCGRSNFTQAGGGSQGISSRGAGSVRQLFDLLRAGPGVSLTQKLLTAENAEKRTERRESHNFEGLTRNSQKIHLKLQLELHGNRQAVAYRKDGCE